MSSKKKNSLYVFIGIVILLAFVAFSMFFWVKDRNHISNSFPYWFEAEKGEIDKNVSMQFNYIDVSKIVNHDESAWDEINFSIKNNSNSTRYYSSFYLVDYLYEGTWYTIYHPESVPIGPLGLVSPQEDKEEFLGVPNGLFSELGIYRIYIRDFGYFEIDIMIPLYQDDVL